MLGHSGGDGQHVRVENYVFGKEAGLLGKQTVHSAAYPHAAVVVGCLSVLVEAHGDYGRSESLHNLCVLQKILLAEFQAYRVYDALSLTAFQALLNNLEAR